MITEIIILLAAVPFGFLIAYIAGDELVAGRKWFYALIIIGVILGGWFWLTGYKAESLTSFFAVIVAFISLVKSRDKNWTKRRI